MAAEDYIDLSYDDLWCGADPEDDGSGDQQVGNACPFCGEGEALVLRTNRSNGNKFVGCGTWPECWYTATANRADLETENVS